MSDEPLFTLRELADQLTLPESTVRYYRDAFLDHIPSVGTGRRRRYPEPALAILRTIAQGYADNRGRAEILGLIDGVTPAASAEPIAAPRKQARRPRRQETTEVTNLDLLAAIVDGEREQREALWQMAQEIVRLTEVLEAQEKVLGELSEHTGVLGRAPQPHSYLAADAGWMPALGQGSAAEPGPVAAAPIATSAAQALTGWLADLLPSGLREPVVAPAPAPAPHPEPSVAQPPEPVARPAPSVPQPPEPAAQPAPSVAQAPEPVARPAAGAEHPTPTSAAAVPLDIDRLRRELEAERALVDRLREAKLKLEQRTTEAEEAVAESRARRRSSVIGRLLQSDRDGP